MKKNFYFNKNEIRDFFYPFLQLIPNSIYSISSHSDAENEAYVGDLSINVVKNDKFIFGTYPQKREIIFSTKVIDLIWITAYATGVMYHTVCKNQDINKEIVEIDINEPKLKTAVNMLESVYQSLKDESALEWDERWPIPDLKSENQDIDLANNLMLGAMAFIFHHEIAHIRQEQDICGIQRELDADMKAANWILGEDSNKETQGLAIVSALIVLNVCGIRLQWWDGIIHPFVYDRLLIVLESFFAQTPNSPVWSYPSVVITTTLALTNNNQYIASAGDLDHRDFLKNQVENLRKMFNDSKPPYIYMDSMVFRYLKNPRLNQSKYDDQTLRLLIPEIYSHYFIPFSEAHCLDLMKNYKEDKNIQLKTKDDLIFINNITSFNAIAITANCSYNIFHYSTIKLFDEILMDTPISKIESNFVFLVDENKIDIKRIPEEHFLFDFLKNTNGVITIDGLLKYLLKISDSLFNDHNIYKKFKNSLEKSNDWINSDPRLKASLSPILPIFDILTCESEKELIKSLPEILNSFLFISGRDWNKLKLFEKIELIYMILDFNPCFYEKLTPKNLLQNMTRDCKHFIYASNADYYITEDVSARKKASFVAKHLNLQVKIVSISEFVSIFRGERKFFAYNYDL